MNPQENIWQFLRQNYLANRVYDTYTELVDAWCDAWSAHLNRTADHFNCFKRMGESGHRVGLLV